MLIMKNFISQNTNTRHECSIYYAMIYTFTALNFYISNINVLNFYRPSTSVIVISLTDLESFLLVDESPSYELSRSMRNPGGFGLGKGPSLPNITATFPMLGRSSGCCWRQRKLTWMHLITSDKMDDEFEFSKHESISSIGLPSEYSFQACKQEISANNQLEYNVIVQLYP